MTIAACYISSEGVVLGTDSTSTISVASPNGEGTTHYFNFGQKLFELGEESSIGVAIWGLGGIGDLSHRTLIARFADSLRGQAPMSVERVASEFVKSHFGEYQQRLKTVVDRFRELSGRTRRTSKEAAELDWLRSSFSGGYCVAGCDPYTHDAKAFEILYRPGAVTAPTPNQLVSGNTYFWGCPNIIERVLFGCDDANFERILASGKWAGTREDLFELLMQSRLAQPADLPLREAVDWVHAAIYTTIKAMKFSHHLPVCGGPIEVAMLSSDRRFRWVKHKRFDDAIGEH